MKVGKEDIGESEIEFIGKLKAFRDQEYINIKNPEYILALLAEDTIMNLIKKEENEEITEEMYQYERKNMMEVLKNILIASDQTARKI